MSTLANLDVQKFSTTDTSTTTTTFAATSHHEWHNIRAAECKESSAVLLHAVGRSDFLA
jgi:hypothetical protein